MHPGDEIVIGIGAFNYTVHMSLTVNILFNYDLNAILLCHLSTVILYALSAVYFAGVMVRLMLTLTPVVCVLAAIAISKTLNEFLVDDAPSKKKFDEDSEYEEDDEEREKKSKKLYDKVGIELIHVPVPKICNITVPILTKKLNQGI